MSSDPITSTVVILILLQDEGNNTRVYVCTHGTHMLTVTQWIIAQQ